MIFTILSYLVIAIVALIGAYMTAMSLTKTAQEKMQKDWEDKNNKLNSWEKDLKSQYTQLEYRAKQVEQQKNLTIAEISQKKSEAIQEYEKALSAIKVAEKIRDDVNLKNETLQKRIDQLQSELFQARNRAKRLANKMKDQ